MVKLLRYYVSEDAVYLHLEHIKGELRKSKSFFFRAAVIWAFGKKKIPQNKRLIKPS